MQINKITPFKSFLEKNQYLPKNFYRYGEKASIKTEIISRRCANKISDMFNKLRLYIHNIFNKLRNKPTINLDKIDFKQISDVPENSAEHMWLSYTISRMLCAGKEVEINVEDELLQEISDSDESCIFIMNHDRQKEDPKLLNFFISLLSREYIYKDKASSCPKPKIVLNRDILDTASENIQILAKKWGAVGIDASLHCTDRMFNAKAFSKLIRGVVENKNNLFIFPEGRMCAFPSLLPQWKFQSGVAEIIRIALNKKERIKVVPLGFAYNKNVGGIHIGKPIYFKNFDNNIGFTKGTINKGVQDSDYIRFMDSSSPIDKEGYHIIKSKGIAVPKEKSGEYIAGILCENLIACKHSAKESIKNVGTTLDDDVIYSLSEEIDEYFV